MCCRVDYILFISMSTISICVAPQVLTPSLSNTLLQNLIKILHMVVMCTSVPHALALLLLLLIVALV
ncbi:hypothetical protein EDC96DRAFT_536604 [Choanephora cucurbitarum]|nr:hypothetical protein EDC96DRAFT_536604 [Choanephora cucurbitarum]